MQDKDTITDVEFKEVLPEPTGGTEEPKEIFNPVVYLTTALVNAGYHDPAGWAKGCDPRAAEATEEKDRIFFANRALRLYLAEVPDRENISPRMLLADGINSIQWCALIDQGIVPWLMNQFDGKGKRIITAKEDPELVAKINAMAPGFVEQPPVWVGATPELKVYEGTLELSSVEKQQLLDFINNPEIGGITIGERAFIKTVRDGANGLEWLFTAEPSVSYLMKISDLSELVGDNSSDDTSLDAWRVRGEEAGAEMLAAAGDPSGEVGTTSDNPIPSGEPGVSGEVNIGTDYAEGADQTAVSGEVISTASEDKPVDWGQIAPSEPQKFPPTGRVEEPWNPAGEWETPRAEEADARPSSVDPE